MMTPTRNDILAFVTGALLGVLGIYALARFTPTTPPAGPNAYRKKPVVIEARQLAGSDEDIAAVIDWITRNTQGVFDLDDDEQPVSGVAIDVGTGFMHIATLEGVMQAKPDDWIIRGVQGEFYPCKPDIFAATYEPAEV